MIILLLSPRLGVINQLLGAVGFSSINFLGRLDMFRSIYVWFDVWQTAGYSAVIYLAALAGVDPALYEAAKVDGDYPDLYLLIPWVDQFSQTDLLKFSQQGVVI